MDENEVVEDQKEKPSLCFACGGKLKNYSLLVCAECLDDSCKEFEDLVSKE